MHLLSQLETARLTHINTVFSFFRFLHSCNIIINIAPATTTDGRRPTTTTQQIQQYTFVETSPDDCVQTTI